MDKKYSQMCAHLDKRWSVNRPFLIPMKVFTSFFFATILIGCASRNSGIAESSKLNEIIVGKTTAAEVISTLGKPTNKIGIESNQTWFYQYRGQEETLHPPRVLPTLGVHFDKDLIVSRLTVADARTKTVRIIGQTSSVSPDREFETNATLLCFGGLQADTIDGTRANVTSMNDVSGMVIRILNFGSVGHGWRHGDLRELINLSPGNHEVGILLNDTYSQSALSSVHRWFEIGGVHTHGPVYKKFDFEAGKEYRLDFAFDKGDSGSGHIVLAVDPLLESVKNWTVITNK